MIQELKNSISSEEENYKNMTWKNDANLAELNFKV